jgi:hypothetical protein
VRFTEIDDALRTLKIAEYRYGTRCGIGFVRVSVVSDPCALTKKLLNLHLDIVKLANQARDAGSTAEHLHKTSIFRPYRSIERTWYDVSAKSNARIHELSNLFISLIDAPNTDAREVTMNTIVAYQNSLEHIVHYANYALYYERAENAASYNDVPETLTFGVTKQNNKAVMERSGSLLFDGVHSEIGNALRSLKLPESLYAGACAAPMHPKSLMQASNPCSMGERFIQIRSAISTLRNRARDAGETAKSLHHTSRSRPYKRIERAWSDVKTRGDALLDTLSEIPPALHTSANNDRRQAGMDVVTAYQSAVEHHRLHPLRRRLRTSGKRRGKSHSAVQFLHEFRRGKIVYTR